MILEAGFDNVHTTNVGNGKSLLASSRNADAAGGRSIAVRNAKRVLGYSTGIGVLRLRNSIPPNYNGIWTSEETWRAEIQKSKSTAAALQSATIFLIIMSTTAKHHKHYE